MEWPAFLLLLPTASCKRTVEVSGWRLLEDGGLTAFQKEIGGWNKVGQCFLEKFHQDTHTHTPDMTNRAETGR